MESVTFSFEGGMADNHELNFYEAGRFQYGAARWLYTLESFRQNKKIVSRLKTKVDVDIRIRAPVRGSFLQEVLIFSAPALIECAIQVPVEAMVAYAWGKIFPTSSRGGELALQIANNELARAQEDTAQEKERTKQFQLLSDVANNNAATAQQTLEILKEVLSNNKQIMINGQEASLNVIQLEHDRVKAEIQRNELIDKHRDSLAAINQEEGDRLAGQLRKSIPDMILPLRSSANLLNIGGGESNKKFVALDFKTGKEISKQDEDRSRTSLRVSFKSFDREQGTGKIRYNEYKTPLPFRLPNENRQELKARILQAMSRKTVLVSVQFIRDQFGNPVSSILWDILTEDYEE